MTASKKCDLIRCVTASKKFDLIRRVTVLIKM